MSMLRTLASIACIAMLAFGLTGCGTIAHKQMVGAEQGPRQIVVFFDGTHNNEISDTNVKKLHSLVTLQPDRPGIFTLYIEGVGTGADVLGMGAGVDMAARVRLGYEFLLQHYRPGDRIYLVGFSRGAFGARILNSLLYHGGLPRKPAGKTYAEVAQAVFSAVEKSVPLAESPPRIDDPAEEQRQYATRLAEAEKGRRHLVHLALDREGLEQTLPVPVHVLALWDTVAAMGVPDWGARILHKMHFRRYYAKIDNPFAQYGDKLCNVEYAFQALAIDDDREWIFTPLLLTRPYLVTGCTAKQPEHGFQLELPPPPQNELPSVENNRVREVWFAGAHSDVGGGYQDTLLSGVSLNWMLQQLLDVDKEKSIVPKGASVPEDIYGSSHDPEAGGWSPLYHALNRDIAGYLLGRTKEERLKLWPDPNKFPPIAPIRVHQSVLDRRAAVPPKWFENHQLSFLRRGKACLATPASSDRGNFDVQGRYKEIQRGEPDCLPRLEINVEPSKSTGVH
jgi:hypothetical protein